jgi:hypothetical protein
VGVCWCKHVMPTTTVFLSMTVLQHCATHAIDKMNLITVIDKTDWWHIVHT